MAKDNDLRVHCFSLNISFSLLVFFVLKVNPGERNAKGEGREEATFEVRDIVRGRPHSCFSWLLLGATKTFTRWQHFLWVTFDHCP